MAAMGSVAG